jgi:hypothetical protein
MGRIHRRAGSHPTAWDIFRTYGAIPGVGRFDHHPPPTHLDHPRRAVLYGAFDDPRCTSFMTCVLECFQNLPVNRWLYEPHFVTFEFTRRVHLLDLSSRWLSRSGGNGAIFSGDHVMSERWSREIYRHYRGCNGQLLDEAAGLRDLELDGLYYRSSSAAPGATCVVLYERARDALPVAPSRDLALSDPAFNDELERGHRELGLRLALPPLRPAPPLAA